MALVRASQSFVMEGYAYFKEKEHLFARPKYVKKSIELPTWVSAICDEAEVEQVIEEKIKQEIQQSEGWGRSFEGWSSYRKYAKAGELESYPNGKEFELKIQYIRDWKMEKIIKELDGNQFAILCKELGVSAEEALNKK